MSPSSQNEEEEDSTADVPVDSKSKGKSVIRPSGASAGSSNRDRCAEIDTCPVRVIRSRRYFSSAPSLAVNKDGTLLVAPMQFVNPGWIPDKGMGCALVPVSIHNAHD